MQFVIICVIFTKVSSIQACGSSLNSPKSNAPAGRYIPKDWVNWDFPPYNDDWNGFVDYLGTVYIPESQGTTGIPDSDENIENAPGFPKQWKNIGVGNSGVDPPSWAKLKGYVGQPPLCLDHRDKGNGTMWLLRWYYNPRKGKCKKFVYSGLGGNANRFLTEGRCIEICIKAPRVPCGPENLFDFASYLEYRRFQ